MGRIILTGLIFLFIGILLYTISFGLWLLDTFNLQIVSSYYFFNLANYFLLIFIVTFVVDLGLLQRIIKKPRNIQYNPVEGKKISVVLTAYNDEKAIGGAVEDFKTINPDEIVVIDNNSKDRTSEVASKAGARVVREHKQGYGYACMRALKEAKNEIVILCEGDQTFKAYDTKKLLAYLENVDMVLGTRITQELLAQHSQLNWFLSWGNLFVAKLIQLRFWGKTRLTDVGCTYRAIRKDALKKIINQLNVGGNNFSPHMTAMALKNGLKVIEVPITFRERVGQSKGVGSSIRKGLITGFKMIWHIYFD